MFFFYFWFSHSFYGKIHLKLENSVIIFIVSNWFLSTEIFFDHNFSTCYGTLMKNSLWNTQTIFHILSCVSPFLLSYPYVMIKFGVVWCGKVARKKFFPGIIERMMSDVRPQTQSMFPLVFYWVYHSHMLVISDYFHYCRKLVKFWYTSSTVKNLYF